MSYDQTQEMFLLGFSSNCGTLCSASDPDIHKCVYDEIHDELSQQRSLSGDTVSLADDWEIVWGPGVAVIPRVLDAGKEHWATNVMYVARKEDDSQNASYFVSIAGTDSKSFFDTLEDFRVHLMRPWPHFKGTRKHAPLISLGFHKGLEVLENMRPPDGMPGALMTLDKFFGNEVKTARGSVSIITGGHSQGGALSPLVALWLVDTQHRWNPRTSAAISSWPFAGLTPGNKAFADYYDERVPNTNRMFNDFDVATKLFSQGGLAQIKTLYESVGILPGPRISNLTDFLIRDTEDNGYTQIGKPIELGGAPKDPSDYHPPPVVPPANDCEKFTLQMGYQHLQSYFDLVGVNFFDGHGTPYCHIDQFQGLCTGAAD